MNTSTKFTLSFLCIAMIVGGQAAVFMWQNHKLLNSLDQLSETSVDEAVHFTEIQSLLHRNLSAIERFLAAKRLEKLGSADATAAQKQAQTERAEIFHTLTRTHEKLQLCEQIAVGSPRAGGVQDLCNKGRKKLELQRISDLKAELAHHEAAVKRLVNLVETDISAANELADRSIVPRLQEKFLPQLEKRAEDAQRQLKQRGNAVAESIRSVNTRMAFIAVGTLVAALVTGLVLSKLFTRPISRLKQAITALAQGDISWRLDDSRPDEFGVFGAAFNEMSENLQQTREALRQASNTTEKRVEKRTVELEKAHQHLRHAQFELVQHEKMSMLGQLAAGMAHEVNTPTAAILNVSVDADEHLQETETRRWLAKMFEALFSGGATQSESAVRGARRQVANRLREAGYGNSRRMAEIIVAYGADEAANDEDFLKHLSQGAILSVLERVLALKTASEISAASAKKIARIVRSLRVYARDSQGEVVDIDVNESIDNTLVILKNRIKNIARVQTHFDENLPSVKCGPDLLQVWTNILINACDAIEESHKDRMGLIEITTRLEDTKVVVGISDDGDAIPEEILPKIFDPFFTTKRIGKGTGLGLSICTSILDRWGGTISAQNEDQRVVFKVSLATDMNQLQTNDARQGSTTEQFAQGKVQ
ncbi:MAG: sensor histidine kinase [Planctomycetota bacterium]|jgi:C4-dicarboxylate-specific signal transduction histidine kinase